LFFSRWIFLDGSCGALRAAETGRDRERRGAARRDGVRFRPARRRVDAYVRVGETSVVARPFILDLCDFHYKLLAFSG
jgi:hypothetical protein